MDEIETIEQQRYGWFALTGLLTAILIFSWRQDVILAALAGLAIGLTASGTVVARKLTAPHTWAYLESEARLNNYSVSKRKVWIGNIVPAGAAVAATIWWLSAA